jgi:hypothetical protein
MLRCIYRQAIRTIQVDVFCAVQEDAPSIFLQIAWFASVATFCECIMRHQEDNLINFDHIRTEQ